MHENLNGFVFRRVSKLIDSPKISKCKQRKLSIRKENTKTEDTKNNRNKAIKANNNIKANVKNKTNVNLNGFIFRIGKKSKENDVEQVKDDKVVQNDKILIDNKENYATPHKNIILSKIKEPTPFRFDKNDFLDIKTPKKSIFYNESFLINSRNKKKPSIFDKNVATTKNEHAIICDDIHNDSKMLKNTNTTTQNIDILHNNICDSVDNISQNVQELVTNILKEMKITHLHDAIKNYRYENLNKKIEQDFVKYITEYKSEIESIKNEIEKWKRMQENVFFENDYFYEPKKYEINEYKSNEESAKQRKIENEYEKYKIINENATKYKNKVRNEIENVNKQIKEIKNKIYNKMENRSKMDPVTLCKAMSRL